MTTGRVQLSFIIPVRDDAARRRRCLSAIAANGGGAAIEIIVAANGSRDGSVDVAGAAGARVLSLPGLRGSELRNRGAGVAAGELLAFVDADHEVGQAW